MALNIDFRCLGCGRYGIDCDGVDGEEYAMDELSCFKEVDE